MRSCGEFTFYPVGQGCFYAGKINSRIDNFVFVFDCGSTPQYKASLQKSIKAFKNAHDKIDLLVISHFHEDHVSGVADLLKGIKCDRIIIPYYDPVTRLSMIGNAATQDEDYISLVRDPINYLTTTDGFDVGEVVIVDGQDGNDSDNNNDNPNDDGPVDNLNFDEYKFKVKEIKDDEQTRSNVESKEGANYDGNSKTKFHSGKLKLAFNSPYWDFIFYLKFSDEISKIEEFNKWINKFLEKTPSGRIQELFNANYREDVRSIYRKTILDGLDFNYSSLTLYHGPRINNTRLCICSNEPCHYMIDKSGTILTGDLFLKKQEDFDSFIRHYSPYHLQRTSVFQVPHHGSDRNWKPLPNSLSSMFYFVINHGSTSIKHPHANVKTNISANAILMKYFSNSEKKNFSYKIITDSF